MELPVLVRIRPDGTEQEMPVTVEWHDRKRVGLVMVKDYDGRRCYARKDKDGRYREARR